MANGFWEGAIAKTSEDDDLAEAIIGAFNSYRDKTGEDPVSIRVHDDISEKVEELLGGTATTMVIGREGPVCAYPTYIYVGTPHVKTEEKGEDGADKPEFGTTLETPESTNVENLLFEPYEDGSNEGALYISYKSGHVYLYTEIPDKYAVRLYSGKESVGKLAHEIADKYTGIKYS